MLKSIICAVFFATYHIHDDESKEGLEKGYVIVYGGKAKALE